MAAIQQICQEKRIPLESVIETIEAALAAAYRKDFGQKNQNIKVEYNPETGESRVFDSKIVVDDELKAKAEAEAAERAAAIERGDVPVQPEPLPAVTDEALAAEGDSEVEAELRYNPKLHISLTDAKEIKRTAELGEEIRVELEPPAEYGRMAAQTAKQVIIQRLREAERGSIFEEFKDNQGSVMIGTVGRREGPNFLIDFGRTMGILPREEQVERERYRLGERIKVYVQSVELTSKGPQIVVSRRSPEIVRELFRVEIPEVASSAIEVKTVAREAGSRSKVAVWTDEDAIDPIGSCVGQRGSRVQTIIHELGGEKIDIIEWSDDPVTYISHALLPAKVLSVEVDEKNKRAVVTVESDQLSLAIGKQGQNVRLAAKLTGYTISIIELAGQAKREVSAEVLEQGLPEPVAEAPLAPPVAELAAPEAEPAVEIKATTTPETTE